MNYNERLTPAKVFGLGAVHGLIVGFVLENARLTYANYQMSQVAREYAQKYSQTAFWGDFFYEASWDPLVPLLCITVFAVVAYLINKFFMNRPHLLLITWFGLGLCGWSVGYFMSTSNPDLFSYLWLLGQVVAAYLIHQLWTKRRDSLLLLLGINGISAVIVGALGVQLVGLFFYWPNARRPLIWLIALLGVIAISAILGLVVEFILSQIVAKKNPERCRRMIS